MTTLTPITATDYVIHLPETARVAVIAYVLKSCADADLVSPRDVATVIESAFSSRVSDVIHDGRVLTRFVNLVNLHI